MKTMTTHAWQIPARRVQQVQIDMPEKTEIKSRRARLLLATSQCRLAL